MKNETPVKLLIQAGIIPENVLQQLKNWRLLPDDVDQSSGAAYTKNWESPEEFVQQLKEAINLESSLIKETQFDFIGSFQKVRIGDSWQDVMVDKLGRLILHKPPAHSSVEFPDGVKKLIVEIESRYQGDQEVAVVCTLASLPKEEENRDVRKAN